MTEEELFLATIELESIGERKSFLDSRCAGDAPMRKRVERLLRLHEAHDPLLDSPESLFRFNPSLERGSGDTGRPHALADDTIHEATGAADSRLPSHLGPYEVLNVIGRGGMGLVLLGRDTKLDRFVAIKLISAELAFYSAARLRFLAEARAAAKLRHPHIVTIFGVHDDEGLPFLVMEYVPGRSLEQELKAQAPFELTQILRVGRQVASALQLAHARGLVHRDIKPANILVDHETGDVKLTDFGLAAPVSDSGAASSSEAIACAGTPSYMSPEQARGRTVDGRSDLYSLGCVLYCLAAGHPPTPADLTQSHSHHDSSHNHARSMRETRPDLPIWFGELVQKLLEREPDRRFPSATELLRQFDQRLSAPQADERPSSAALTVPGGLAPSSATSDKHQPATESRRRFTSNDWLRRIPIAGFAIALAAGLVVIVVKSGDRSTRVEVPAGARVVVAPNGDVEVDVTGATGAGEAGKGSSESRPKPAVPPPDAAKITPRDPIEVRQWEESLANLDQDELASAIAARLRELNPGFSAELKTEFEGRDLVSLEFIGDAIFDLSPLRPLKKLRRLDCAGANPSRRSQLADLSPLKGLPLEFLSCGRSQVADLRPLEGMPLVELNCCDSSIHDLAPLAGMKLRVLSIQSTNVASLAPLRGMSLVALNCSHTPVTDLAFLEGMPLAGLFIDGTKCRDFSPLKSLPLQQFNWRIDQTPEASQLVAVRAIRTLKTIDGIPTEEYWRQIDNR